MSGSGCRAGEVPDVVVTVVPVVVSAVFLSFLEAS